MADFELNPMFLRMRKSIGDMVIYERNGQLRTRVKGKRVAPPSEAQLEVTNTFARMSSDWSSAGTLMNASWYSYGAKKKTNGYNLYMKTNFKHERVGNAVELFKPLGEIESPAITVSPGASGQITCAYTIPAVETGRHIHFFVKKRVLDESEEMIKRYSPDISSSSPFTINNLEPESEYYIYAALTDQAYKDATQVSASVSAITTAGV